jgi:hypothetical protein
MYYTTGGIPDQHYTTQHNTPMSDGVVEMSLRHSHDTMRAMLRSAWRVDPFVVEILRRLHMSPAEFEVLRRERNNDQITNSLICAWGRALPRPADRSFPSLSTNTDTAATPEPTTCVVCTENRPGVLFNPCGHACCCRTCATKMRARSDGFRCPLCRGAVEAWSPLHLP